MTPNERAKRLAELLEEDSILCYDVAIKQFKSQVSYEDQGGRVGIDFKELTLTERGCLEDQGLSKEDFVITPDTINIKFWGEGPTHFSRTRQFKSLEELRTALDDWSLFADLEGVEDCFK